MKKEETDVPAAPAAPDAHIDDPNPQADDYAQHAHANVRAPAPSPPYPYPALSFQTRQAQVTVASTPPSPFDPGLEHAVIRARDLDFDRGEVTTNRRVEVGPFPFPFLSPCPYPPLCPAPGPFRVLDPERGNPSSPSPSPDLSD